MRTFVKTGLVAAFAVAAAACASASTPQKANDPIGGEPKPQAAISHPTPQADNPVIGPRDPKPQAAINTPSPQQSSFNDPTAQKPISDPSPQKPLFPADDNKNVTPQAQAKAVKLNDGQILAVASVANSGEVDAAEVARKNASSADVKQFAAMMMTHHRDAMNKERQVQDKAKVQLEENDVSTTIKSEGEQSLATLRNQSGAEFDRMYIDSQVKMHKDVLDTIDAQLLPNASSPAVKAHLQEMRKSVAAHLAKAEQLQKKLDPSLAKAQAKDKADDAKAKANEKSNTTNKQKTPDTSRSNTDKPNPHEH